MNYKVMIVEDDPLLSILEEKLVTRLGYEVVGKAVSGEDALLSIEKVNPEILLIDVQLSGALDGIQTVKKLREKKIDLPVIFLSGDNSSRFDHSVKETNYIDFLLKPVSMNELSIPLKRASEKIESRSQNAA